MSEPQAHAPRVVHLNTAKTWRGGERQVWFLARGLAKRGVTQWIVGQPGSELEDRSRAANLPFVGIRMRGEWDYSAVRHLRNFARENDVNLLHAHTARAHSLGLWAAGGLPQAQLIVSRRVDFPAGKNWFSRRKYLSDSIARYIAISENVRGVLIRDGVNPDRIRIAYSGIDLNKFAPLEGEALAVSRANQAAMRAEFGLPDSAAPVPVPVIIGNVAALVDHKDQRTLIAALGRLHRAGRRDFRCLVFGEGKLRGELEAQARELGLLGDRAKSASSAPLVFAGFRDAIDDAYRLLDIFVMSSKEEGLGTAVLDAMGFGLPVVATRGGGIPEMIEHGRGGLLCPVGDDGALAEALGQMIDDAARRKTCGAFNESHVRRFSHEATCAATLEIYSDVLAAQSQDRGVART